VERLVVWLRWIIAARDGAEEARAAAAQARAVSARLVAVGGDVLTQLSGTVVATFEPSDLPDALDAMLDLCDEADHGESPVRIALGLALGALGDEGGVPVGAALDRAQALASRGRDGEIVLDQEARDRAAPAFLFSRVMAVGPGGPRGFAIDRKFPRREPCREAVRGLGEPIVPPAHAALLALLRDAATSAAPGRVLLRGGFGEGARTTLAALARELRPGLVLDLRPVPGALDPLGSLAAALRLAAPLLPLGLPGTPTLTAIADAREVTHADALAALVGLVANAAHEGKRVWFLLDPLVGLDPASVELVAEATGDQGCAALVVARLPVGAKAPSVLLRGGTVTDRVLPSLRTADARAIASDLLGASTDDDVARRVAVLGGDSPVGVLEATRTLLATGELVRRDDAFVWRLAPRASAASATPETLVSERLAMLDENAYRALEALCLTPEGAPPAIARHIAANDGMSAEAWARGFATLEAEGVLPQRAALATAPFLVRNVVVEALQPARASELHRFAAEALRAEDSPGVRAFGAGTIARYLVEGGRPAAASELLLRTAERAREAGFERAAVHLAAAAVRADPTDATRRAAAALVAEAPKQSEYPPARADSDTVERAVRAIVAKDFDAVERVVEAAVAAGGAPAAAERIRAVAQLARGDVGAALRTLQRNRRLARDGDTSASAARASLALALVLLNAGDPIPAVRAAVGALASARARSDARGEDAALRALASCYRALGRMDDAARLDQRA
jgi:hypothetical protein